ncbi:FkbM family methyltransferase [bacterium]|nr:FkbM family methyltransferase [bacterium]
MLIFDIGANVGAWALANLTPTTTIISVEASPITFQQLKAKVAREPKIVPLNFAVCQSETPTITFYHCTAAGTISTLDKDWLSSPESRFGNYRTSIQEVTVPTKSIDALIAEYGMPDILKIDVEGAEHLVLQSLSIKVPLLCFEWAAEWKEKNIACINRLLELGFRQFAVQYEDKYTWRPHEFSDDANSIISIFNTAVSKKEWGMIWAQ